MRYGAILGDSFTFNTGNGLTPDQYYPHQASKRLDTSDLRIITLGVSGNTSAAGVGRMSALFTRGVPAWVGIYLGANDTNAGNQSTVQASPAPTSTTFSVGVGKAATMAKPGSWLTVNGEDRQVLSVATDAITLATALSSTPASGDAVAIATTKNLIQIGQFVRAKGCQKVWFGLAHYLNWSTGGDTVGSPASSGTAMRAKQQAAATALSAEVVDFYTPMRARIVAGTDTQGYVATTVAAAASADLFTVASASGLAIGKRINVDNQLAEIVDLSGKLVTVEDLKVPPGASSTVSTNWHVADGDPHLAPYGGYVMGGIVADQLIALGWEQAA